MTKAKFSAPREFTRRFGLVPMTGWTLVMLLVLGWTIYRHHQETVTDAANEARNYFKLNRHYRAWNARMGGIYASVDKVAPNPHLTVTDREVITTEGRRLTLINPAYMTRMVSDAIRADSGIPVINKLTSLKALNPANSPDPWEQQALIDFQRGRKEDRSEVISLNGVPYLRLISRFETEQSCLKCHAAQGYRLGDVRGAISISVPLAPYLQSERRTTNNIVGGYLLLWAAGCAGIAGYSRRRFSQEKSLGESERKFRTFVETAQEGIWQIDAETRTLFVNRRMAEMLGYPESEILGRSLYDFMDLEWRQKALAFFEERRQGSADQHEFRFQRRDGSGLWTIVSATPQFSESGQFHAAVAFVNDITDRKRAESSLVRQEQEVRTILSHLPDVVSRIDRAHRHLYVSPAITRATGLPPETFIGKTNRELGMPEDLLSMWDAALEETFSTGSEATVSFVFPSTEGNRHYDSRIIPERADDGSIVSVLTIARDLTEKYSAEEALRASEEKYRSLFTTMQEGFALHEIICDELGTPHDYRFLDVNPAFEKITGLARSSVIGKTVREVIPKLEEDWITAYGKVALTGAATHFERFAKDMGCHFEVTAYSPKPGQFATIFFDVSEKRRLQEEAIKSQKLESLGMLAGGIAHDFNNILTAIVGNISLARFMVGEQHEAAQRLSECEKASSRAAELTRQLLTFARGGEPEKAVVDTVQLVREAVSFSLRGSNCLGTFELEEGVWPLDADAGQIHQALNNLVLNALQAMPEGGPLTIRATNWLVGPAGEPALPPGRYVRISITDQGCGIPQENLKKIFDPYFTTKDRGTGLGLTSVYSIVKRHGGLIWVDSSTGTGSTFEMVLPAASGTIRETQPQTCEQHPMTDRASVLVMDDEEMIRTVAASMLTQLGYTPITCADGAEAIRLYREALDSNEPFTAVILDMTVPGGMGGKEAAEKIRGIDSEAVLIISSGYRTESIFDNDGVNLFNGAVKKPYNLSQLARVIARKSP